MTSGQETSAAGTPGSGPTTTVQSAAAGPHRSWLPVFIIVCLVAVLGGAGAVMLTGDSQDAFDVHGPGTGGRVIRVRVEKAVEPAVFNLRASRGARFARVSFLFDYRVHRDLAVEAAKEVEANWDEMVSDVLCILMRRTAHELESENGRAILADELIEGLNRALFKKRALGQPLAQVDKILWKQVFIQ